MPEQYPDPQHFADFSVNALLSAAAMGRIGVDQRLIQSIIDRGEAAIPELVAFSEADSEERRLDLSIDLVQLFRHFRTPAAAPFYTGIVKEFANEEMPDELIDAIAELGAPMMEPLLALYEELGEQAGGGASFLLAGLGVRDERILHLLLEHLEYDAWEGALHLGLYGDPGGKPALQSMRAEPNLDAEIAKQIDQSLAEIDLAANRAPFEAAKWNILEEYEPVQGPDFDILDIEELEALLSSSSAEYRAAALEALGPGDVSEELEPALILMAETDPDANVRGRAWEALAVSIESNKALLAKMKAALQDESKPIEERTGAMIALATATSGSSDLTARIKEFYEKPELREFVLKAMWRSMDQSFGSYMQFHLDDPDPNVQEQAIFGIGHLNITSEANRLEAFFDSTRLRPAALYNYALIIPGPKNRMGVKAMLAKIDKVAKGLDQEDTEIVKAGLDRRLEMRGMKPVFHEEEDVDE